MLRLRRSKKLQFKRTGCYVYAATSKSNMVVVIATTARHQVLVIAIIVRHPS